MGCGKSKHDVASGNTNVLRREKSCVSFKENETETKNTNINNIDDVSSVVEVEVKESESVKENGDKDNKDYGVNDGEDKEKINDEENKEGNVVEESSNDVEKNNDDTLIENGEKINDDEKNEDNAIIEKHYDEIEKNGGNVLIENEVKINDIYNVSSEEKILVEEDKKGDINTEENTLTKEEIILDDTNITTSIAKFGGEKN